MNRETWREIYTVQAVLIFSWSDTCWECRIWRTDNFRFC